MKTTMFKLFIVISALYLSIDNSFACPINKIESSLISLSYGSPSLYMNTRLLVEIGDQKATISEIYDSKGKYLPASAITIEQYTEYDTDNRFFLWKMVFPKKLGEPLNYIIITPNPSSMLSLFDGMNPLLLHYKMNVKGRTSSKKISGKFLIHPNQIGCAEIRPANQ